MENNLKKLIGLQIKDVLLGGIVFPKGEAYNFVPDFGTIYFVFDGYLLELVANEIDLSVNAAIVSKMSIQKDLADGELPSRISISHIVLLDTLMRNIITKIVIYGSHSTTEENTRFNALSIFLDNGMEIFLDGCSTLGLNLGGTNQRLLWLQNNLQFPNFDVKPTEIVS